MSRIEIGFIISCAVFVLVSSFFFVEAFQKSKYRFPGLAQMVFIASVSFFVAFGAQEAIDDYVVHEKMIHIIRKQDTLLVDVFKDFDRPPIIENEWYETPAKPKKSINRRIVNKNKVIKPPTDAFGHLIYWQRARRWFGENDTTAPVYY